MDRLLDELIAYRKYGWKWENGLLIPPEDDPKRYQTAKYDKHGIPHFLPRYSEMEENKKLVEELNEPLKPID
jgi:hypothetical protein